MTKFSAGDLVRAIDCMGAGSLVVGDVYTVDSYDTYTRCVYLRGLYNSYHVRRFELVVPETFKIGDRVIVSKDATWGSGVLKYSGSATVARGIPDTDGDISVKFDGDDYNWYVNIDCVSLDSTISGEPQVGDTVEIVDNDGTVIRGTITWVSSSGAIDIGTRTSFVSDRKSLTIVERPIPVVEPEPKAWAVGDMLENGDYASETLVVGTAARGLNVTRLYILTGDRMWTDVSSGFKYTANELSSPRVIVFVP